MSTMYGPQPSTLSRLQADIIIDSGFAGAPSETHHSVGGCQGELVGWRMDTENGPKPKVK
jgi:hypothetical protein